MFKHGLDHRRQVIRQQCCLFLLALVYFFGDIFLSLNSGNLTLIDTKARLIMDLIPNAIP
jgi:hypothetical protein